MNMESVESVIYDVTAEFFHGATVIWAEQVNTKPDLPYVTLKTGNLNRTRFPVVDDDGNRFYPCSTLLEINLYTKGKAVTVAENVTGNYANTAASDLQDFFNYLDSEEIVDKLAAHGMDISLEPPVRDLTQEANGRYGIGGMDAPNASGGGSAEMADTTSGVIEEVEISEETYEGGKA